jgi:hypothetical protein
VADIVASRVKSVHRDETDIRRGNVENIRKCEFLSVRHEKIDRSAAHSIDSGAPKSSDRM